VKSVKPCVSGDDGNSQVRPGRELFGYYNKIKAIVCQGKYGIYQLGDEK
jgi:hypothetical protein